MALSTELSGVQAAQTDIDTIGNNISNINTVGFKESVANFSDLYGSSLQGASGNTATPGQGVTTSSLSQLFSEGTITQTGNPLDISINGNGFFQIQTGSGVAYSRDGAFQLSKNGNLVTDSGAMLMGYAASAATSGAGGATSSGFLAPIQVNESNIAPTATQNLKMDVNLPASDAAIDTTAVPFSLSNAASYNESTTTTV